MDPVITLPALYHFAITVIIALITEWADVAWEGKKKKKTLHSLVKV